MQDKLFHLIKSLSKNEKRYFKLFASMYKRDTIYLALFDLLERQREYDEPGIHEMLHGRGVTSQPHVLKNYLYRLILKSLRSFHSAASINAQLKEMLRDVEILYDRGLYEQCEEIVRRSRGIAETHDEFHHLIEIGLWSRRLLERKRSVGKEEMREMLIDLYEDERRVIGEMRSIGSCRHTSAMLSLFDASARKPSDIDEIRGLVPSEVAFGDERDLTTYQAKAQLLHTRMNYLSTVGELDEHYECARRFLELVKTRPRDARTIGHHIAALSHLINNLLMSRRYEETAEALEEMRELEPEIERHPSIITRAHYRLLFHIYSFKLDAEAGEFVSGFARLAAIRHDLDLLERHPAPSYLTMLHYFIAVICFGAEQYDAALEWLGRVLNASHAETDPTIYSTARMVQIIIHYERGHDELVEDLIRSCYRFLYKQERLHPTETVILRSLRKMLDASGVHEVVEELECLRSELRSLEQEASEPREPAAFDFLAWAESRIEGKSFAEIVHRNLLLRNEAHA